MNFHFRALCRRVLALFFFAFLIAGIVRAQEPAPAVAPPPTLHPALFLVGDSITKSGKLPGDSGPWGMGYEIIPMFDPAKIHVYNEGAGGRSSRSYVEEGLWAKVLGPDAARRFRPHHVRPQ